jgi:dTMP kinase
MLSLLAMRFIVFEGLDGAGKSTLIQGLLTCLQDSEQPHELVRDPGTTSVGEKLRGMILDPGEKPSAKTEILMYEASRAQLVDERIKPALDAGKWVISDRFYSSTIAFQCFARGLNLEEVEWLNHYACSGLQPDLFIFIDISVEESQRRQNKRNLQTGGKPDRMENENVDFHQKVRQGYLQQAKDSPERWLVLDGMKTPKELFEDVRKHLQDQKWLKS